MSLPAKRWSHLVTAELGPHSITVSTSMIGGRVVEVFIDLDHREGAPLVGFCHALARLVSLALQAGTPIADVVRALRGVAGMPGPVVGLEGVGEAQSIPDLVSHILERAEQ